MKLRSRPKGRWKDTSGGNPMRVRDARMNDVVRFEVDGEKWQVKSLHPKMWIYFAVTVGGRGQTFFKGEPAWNKTVFPVGG